MKKNFLFAMLFISAYVYSYEFVEIQDKFVPPDDSIHEDIQTNSSIIITKYTGIVFEYNFEKYRTIYFLVDTSEKQFLWQMQIHADDDWQFRYYDVYKKIDVKYSFSLMNKYSEQYFIIDNNQVYKIYESRTTAELGDGYALGVTNIFYQNNSCLLQHTEVLSYSGIGIQIDIEQFRLIKKVNQFEFISDGYYIFKSEQIENSNIFNINSYYTRINDNDVNFRSGPSLNDQIIGKFNKGDLISIVELGFDNVTVNNKHGHWIKVKNNKMQEGYIWYEYIEKGYYDPRKK